MKSLSDNKRSSRNSHSSASTSTPMLSRPTFVDFTDLGSTTRGLADEKIDQQGVDEYGFTHGDDSEEETEDDATNASSSVRGRLSTPRLMAGATPPSLGKKRLLSSSGKFESSASESDSLTTNNNAQEKAWSDFMRLADEMQRLPRAYVQKWNKSARRPDVVLFRMPSEEDEAAAAPDTLRAERKRRKRPFRRLKRFLARAIGRVSLSLGVETTPRSFKTTDGATPKSSFTPTRRLAPHQIRPKTLTNLIRTHGVPKQHRAQMWFVCSGACDKMRDAKESYSALCRRISDMRRPPESAATIERDLHRTFPTNVHFEKFEVVDSLRRVLVAYSVRNTDVGYCQSMNFIVAVLLLHMEEDQAFWVLASILEDLVPGYHTKNMVGMRVDGLVFDSLVLKRMPRLHARLLELEVPFVPLVYQWFLCLFVNALPLESTLRVWDVFLHEGVKALFRVGLTVLKLLRKNLLKACSFQHAYSLLSRTPRLDTNRFGSGNVTRLAFDSLWFGPFSGSEIQERRMIFEELVLKERRAEWSDPKSLALIVEGVGDASDDDEKEESPRPPNLASSSDFVYGYEGHRRSTKSDASLPSAPALNDSDNETIWDDSEDEFDGVPYADRIEDGLAFVLNARLDEV